VIGKSRSHVANTLRLLKLPEDVRGMVSSGTLTAGHARTLITVEDPSGLARQIVDKGLSVREAEALSQQREAPARKLPVAEPARDADTVALERRLSDVLGLSVSLNHSERADGKHDVMLFSDGGKAVRFDENDVRPMGRNARGVKGMTLEEGQSVIAMLVAEDESQSVLTATENGYGKRTSIVEYTRHGRGTKGMIAIQQSERNGKVVAATLVHADDEIMLITDTGVLVRTRVSEIRELGRATQGVTLISLDEGAKLGGLQRIVENDANEAEGEGEASGDEAPDGSQTAEGTGEPA
jgi:DNA gyrase/topoisomerase IV subunit A